MTILWVTIRLMNLVIELESSHEEESEFDDNGGLLVAEDEFGSKEEDNTSKSDIKIPDYMKDSETTKVTYLEKTNISTDDLMASYDYYL